MVELPTCLLTATLYLLPTDEGGRQSAIRKDVYRPQFFLGLSSASCRVDEIDKGTLSPGEEGEVEMTLVHPEQWGQSSGPEPNLKYEKDQGLLAKA
jgi:translation elongation factor EF-Tu-like GTPase